ncbi:MAG: hypothetical protein HDQ99_18230 [Lachnospiraceae bacterium]|nr:hypothetical protein [Lachnospiraceae bacterium]
MEEILGSSITSNVIAALSFLVCLASLLVTFRTMISAKKIQQEMEKMKINVLDRQRFLGYKVKAIKSITTHKNAVEKAEVISKKNCMQLSELVTEAKGFKNIFKEDDYNKIEDIHLKLKKIGLLKEVYSYKHTQEFLELIIQFKNILEKGDYAL